VAISLISAKHFFNFTKNIPCRDAICSEIREFFISDGEVLPEEVVQRLQVAVSFGLNGLLGLLQVRQFLLGFRQFFPQLLVFELEPLKFFLRNKDRQDFSCFAEQAKSLLGGIQNSHG